MSSIGLSGLSNISQNTLQTRYQKALKQINKLIDINRQLKESSNQHQSQVEKLLIEVEKLERTNQQLYEENNILESKYNQLEHHYHDLQIYCKELEDKLDMNQINLMDNDHFSDKLRQTEAKLHQQLQNQIVKYNQLARQAEFIHQVYQQNLATLQVQTERTKQLQSENKTLQHKYTQLSTENLQLSTVIREVSTEEVTKKFEHANKTIDKLMKECNELKSKQIDLEVLEEKKKVERSIGYSTLNDPRQSQPIKLLIEQYKKKLKTAESERKKYEQKYKLLKAEVIKMIPEDVYKQNISILERLTEKQQAQMGKIIDRYDKQLNHISYENSRLKQSHLSLVKKLTQKSMERNTSYQF